MFKRGNDVELKSNTNYTEKFIRLKEGGSAKLIFLTPYDYVEYPAHADFMHKIYPQTCLKAIKEECPYCKVKGKIDKLKPTKRFLFGFYNVDNEEINYFDATYTQGSDIITAINSFKEDIEYGTVFTFSRTGTKTNTRYNLNAIAERKLTAKDKQALNTAKEMSIKDETFEEILQPKSRKFCISLLHLNTELDIREFFDDAQEIIDELAESDNETKDETKEDFKP